MCLCACVWFFFFISVCGCVLTRRGVGQGCVFTMFVDSGGKLSKKKKKPSVCIYSGEAFCFFEKKNL